MLLDHRSGTRLMFRKFHSTEYGIGLSNDMLLFDKPVSKNGELGHHLDLIFAIYTFILDFLVDVKRLVSN